ncbi:unnamed protein product [Parnassius apollo]|uniref:(apollo) hypothetical protein n=1 Tax=Parnassius apollo TaxID=110799 RepID=A0A8S3WDF9_PARAO|nr:unnamed protein product [Parnassius apollo]
MGTMQLDDNLKRELDDSGCVQDEPFALKHEGENGRVDSVQLLDLSDDVMLYILKHCSARDLKALGFSCSRLARLVLEKSLWRNVEARTHPNGRAHIRWLLAHGLHADTTRLMLAGFARQAAGCLGHVNSIRESEAMELENESEQRAAAMLMDQANPLPFPDLPVGACRRRPHRARFHISANQLPRFSGSPCWPEEVGDEEEEIRAEDVHKSANGVCCGPQFTLTSTLLSQLQAKCPNLTSLALEYCNINCKTTGVNLFPPTLKTLSLRGSKCFNLPMDKSFLFKIQDYVPDLETVDVSECEWLEPSSLLPLSKLRILRQLFANNCSRLSEFVAYASLASRYGFRELVELELCGCPVADSEVSALGWLPALRTLRLAAAPCPCPSPSPTPSPCLSSSPTAEHSHHRTAPAPTPNDTLAAWELQEPEYFKHKLQAETEMDSNHNENQEGQSNSDRTQKGTKGEMKEDSDVVGKNSLKRKPADGSGDSSAINGNEPSTSKRKRFPDNGEGRSQWMNDMDESDDDSHGRRVHRNSVRVTVFRTTVTHEHENKQNQNGEAENAKENEQMESEGDGNDQNNVKAEAKEENGDPDEKSNGEGYSNGENAVNNEASTSNESREVANPPALRGYICFRRHRNPLYHEMPEPQPPPQQEEAPGEPVHRVLYVNFGQPSQIMYSYPRYMNFVSDRVNVFSPTPTHLDSSSLVSDSSVRRFGRADDEDINYVHIGPNGPIQGNGESFSRPDRSSLRILSMVGYRHITDRSLVHLATAAPYLQFLDFRGTSVTAQGVANFKTLRPDCEVRFGEIKDE